MLEDSVIGDRQQLPGEVTRTTQFPLWGYPIVFVLAVLIEFLACLPGLANLGMRHSASAAVSDWELRAQFWLFVLHLPTAAVPWVLSKVSQVFSTFYIFVPFTQIIFWTIILRVIWQRLARLREA
jgi:hypothetical protein